MNNEEEAIFTKALPIFCREAGNSLRNYTLSLRGRRENNYYSSNGGASDVVRYIYDIYHQKQRTEEIL